MSDVAAREPALSAPMVLFEIALDIDHDGKMDRAVLVTHGDDGSVSTARDFYMLAQEQRADLLIYLGGGNTPRDLARKPDFAKEGIATAERNNQIYPLEKNDKGSLVVKTAFNLFSNWAPETLTIVYRNGTFIVAGLTYSYERKDGARGGCDVNFLSGKGTASKGVEGKPRQVKEKLAPVKLADWSEKKYPKACR